MRLLTKTVPEIIEYSNMLDEESKALVKEILRIAWQMRGGVTLDQAYALTYEERTLIGSLIEENMEITKDTKLPFI
jgi:hypothetical protein